MVDKVNAAPKTLEQIASPTVRKYEARTNYGRMASFEHLLRLELPEGTTRACVNMDEYSRVEFVDGIWFVGID